jgi:hypothetical protein
MAANCECYFAGEVVILAFKKMFYLGDETKVDIINGPSNDYALQCFIDKKVREFIFSITFMNNREDDLKVMVSDVVRERSLNNTYLFMATSEQMAGRFQGFYNAESRKGTLVKLFDERHN